jgi:hypothetical protein
MGRGLGEVQRSILAALREDAASEPVWPGLRPEQLARALYGRRPTAVQLESMRRAIRTLKARELVEYQRTLGRGHRVLLVEQRDRAA